MSHVHPITQAECGSRLADGQLLTVTATRRPRAGRADVKASVGGAPELGMRIQQVLRLARLTEPGFDSRDQVVVSLDRIPAPHERDWELAVVLADRMVRGVWQAGAPVLANGWSGQWQLGRIDGHDNPASASTTPHGAEGQFSAGAPGGLALLGGADGLTHLGALTGQPDAGAAVSSARAWFPLHSGGINDSLCWIEVSVYPATEAGADEEQSIAAPGLDLAQQAAVRQVLAGARHFDGRALGRWRSVVRFEQARFSGNSFELALVMADRMARGREFLARGRLIASGQSSAWHAGRVDTVEGCAPKCALILRQAVAGDRVLLPKQWEADAAAGCGPALRERGASVAWIDRIGMI